MGSPFDRLDRKLRDELRIGDEGGYASSDAPTPSLPSGYDLPGLGNGDSTYGNVSTGTVESVDLARAPLSVQGSRIEGGDTPKAARQRNPFASATGSNVNSQASWNGIADLRSTPLNARFAKPKPLLVPSDQRTTQRPHVNLDDSDDDIRLNMSPPVTMTFNLPARAQAVLAAGRTPIKSNRKPLEKEGEARMILDDLMEEMERGYEPSPRMPTPDGLGRYSIVPGELASGSGGRMLFSDGGGGEETYHPTRKSMANTSFGSDGVVEGTSHPPAGVYNDDEDSFDVEDSFDSPTTAGPSHYTQGHGERAAAQVDDSYISMSPNTSEAGMIFGGPPQQNGRMGRGRFSLMKPDEMMTFHGGRLEDAAGRDMQDSPTHAVLKGAGR